MDLLAERKLEASGWIIKARWFYMIGILSIGVLTKTLSNSNLNFSIFEMLAIVFFYILFNGSYFLLYKKILKQKSETGSINKKLIKILNYTQVIIELLTFTYVMHKAGGVESISSVFFFLTIVYSSILLGTYGSVIVGIVSGILINGLIVMEYYNYIPHINRYSETTLEFQVLSIGLTKTITTSVFYFIIGVFSAFGSSLLFKREILLQEQSQKLHRESELRNSQLHQLDKTAKLLVGRDRELSEINVKLDKKIEELENSKYSLMSALNEVQDAKKRIEEERNKTLAIISNFSDPIIVLDKENKIALFNAAAKMNLGLEKEDIGQEVSMKDDFSLENFRSVIRKRFDFKKLKTDKKGDNLLAEELHILKGDKLEQETTYKVITVNIKDSKKNYSGVMKIFYDFTREKIIDKMKSDFISIVAHQLRTPLSAIKWSIGMVQRGDSGEINSEQANLLHKSYESNERMINLVNDLLNVSRIEEGRFGYDFKEIILQEVINAVIENCKQSIDKNKINLVINEEPKYIKVCADKDKLILAVQNLFDNAIKYTPRHGKIEVNLKKEKGSNDEGEIALLSIKDDGVGIPQKEQERIFSKFFRASNVMRMQTDGTGLGLFIVKNIIDKHAGEIKLSSKEGEGTEIVIKLPIECRV